MTPPDHSAAPGRPFQGFHGPYMARQGTSVAANAWQKGPEAQSALQPPGGCASMHSDQSQPLTVASPFL